MHKLVFTVLLQFFVIDLFKEMQDPVIKSDYSMQSVTTIIKKISLL